jgi:hypothetical protein
VFEIRLLLSLHQTIISIIISIMLSAPSEHDGNAALNHTEHTNTVDDDSTSLQLLEDRITSLMERQREICIIAKDFNEESQGLLFTKLCVLGPRIRCLASTMCQCLIE